MICFRNKVFFTVALLAASVFLSVSLGGEFFHQNIHYHQSKASHDSCPVYQLLAQAFLFFVALAFVLKEVNVSSIVIADEILISRPKHLRPQLRAPPSSL